MELLKNEDISLSQNVYETIKQSIVLNEFKQGETLTEEKLSKKLKTSRTPVRTALKRLQYENLIIKDHSARGLVVSNISEDDMKDIAVIRESLAILSVKELKNKITPQELDLLETYLTTQETAAQNKDYVKFIEMEFNFHSSLAKFTKNKFLYEIADKIETSIQRYLILSGSLNKHSVKAVEEHRKVVCAIKNNDFMEAENQMKEHIESSINRMFK